MRLDVCVCVDPGLAVGGGGPGARPGRRGDAAAVPHGAGRPRAARAARAATGALPGAQSLIPAFVSCNVLSNYQLFQYIQMHS